MIKTPDIALRPDISMDGSIGYGYGGGWFTNLRGCRYRVYFGGRSTKKSENIMGREPIFKILENPLRNVVMIRQNDTDNASSTFPNLVSILNVLGIGSLFRIYTSPYKIVRKDTGQEIRFKGFNDPSGVLSEKFITGYWTDTYIEEASQIKSYEDFRRMDGSMRRSTTMPDSIDLQITMTLNPWDVGCWIYDRFVKGFLSDTGPDVERTLEKRGFREKFIPDFDLGKGPGLYLHQSAFTINEFRDPEYDVSAQVLKERAPDIYRVECLGMWGNTTASTYPEFSTALVLPWLEVMNRPYAEYAIGIDIGLSSGSGKLRKDSTFRSATTVQLVGATEGYGKMAFIDEWFRSNDGLSSPMTADDMKNGIMDCIAGWMNGKYRNHPELMKGVVNIFVDNEDIAFIQGLELEARNRGMYMLRFFGSNKHIMIQTRVDWWRLCMGMGDLIISDSCDNLRREIQMAHRDPKTNACRADGNDHAINAAEYGSASFMRKMVRFKDFKER